MNTDMYTNDKVKQLAKLKITILYTSLKASIAWVDQDQCILSSVINAFV